MGLFDRWIKRSSPPREDRNRYLASVAGAKGLLALRISGFDTPEDKQHLVFGRFVGRRSAKGIEFVPSGLKEARAWALAVSALEKVAGPFRKTVLKSGGTIVVSADVNVNAGGSILEQIKATVDSFIQRYWSRGTKVNDAIEQVEQRLRPADMPEEERVIPAYSMGNLFQGRYHGKDPRTGKMTLFNEQSFAVEVRGVDTDVLDAVADSIRQMFNQYAVLVLNDNENNVYLIEQDQQKEAPAKG